MDQGKIFEKRMPRTPTKHTGVYARESQIKTHKGHPDICFDISYKKDGRLIWEKAGYQSEGYSPKLASEIRSERLRMIRHGLELPKEKKKIPLFSEAAELYLSWGRENKKDKNDPGRFENHLKDPLGKKHLNEISAFDLERIKSNLFKKDLSPATVRHCLQFVRAVYNKMLIWNKYTGTNPVKNVSFPTLNNKRERFLSFEEAQNLLQELKKGSQTSYEIALVSLHTGMRAGEIFNLRTQDLDFSNGIIRIADPKNKSSRHAFMTDHIKDVLKFRVQQKEPGDLVFLPRIHAKSQISRVSGFFQRTADSLFNKAITDRRERAVFHSLRHTFGSWLAIQGTPLLAIKELLGHKTLAMTERYSHLSPDVKKEATRALGAAFEQSRNEKKIASMARAKQGKGGSDEK